MDQILLFWAYLHHIQHNKFIISSLGFTLSILLYFFYFFSFLHLHFMVLSNHCWLLFPLIHLGVVFVFSNLIFLKYGWCTRLYQSLPYSKVIQLYMESKISHKWIYLQNRNRLTDTDNRLVVANGSCIWISYLVLLILIKAHSESHFPVAISNSISIKKCVTQQGPMGPLWDRPLPHILCLLIKNL